MLVASAHLLETTQSLLPHLQSFSLQDRELGGVPSQEVIAAPVESLAPWGEAVSSETGADK